MLPVITAGPKRGLAGSSHSCMEKGCRCVLVLGRGMVCGLAAIAWSWRKRRGEQLAVNLHGIWLGRVAGEENSWGHAGDVDVVRLKVGLGVCVLVSEE